MRSRSSLASAFDDVFAQALRGPDAELGASVGLRAVAEGDDHVEGEVLDLIGLPVRGSCCKFCGIVAGRFAPPATDHLQNKGMSRVSAGLVVEAAPPMFPSDLPPWMISALAMPSSIGHSSDGTHTRVESPQRGAASSPSTLVRKSLVSGPIAEYLDESPAMGPTRRSASTAPVAAQSPTPGSAPTASIHVPNASGSW